MIQSLVHLFHKGGGAPEAPPRDFVGLLNAGNDRVKLYSVGQMTSIGCSHPQKGIFLNIIV